MANWQKWAYALAKMGISNGRQTRRDGGKLISFLESAHQSYLESSITTPAPRTHKLFVDQCYMHKLTI